MEQYEILDDAFADLPDPLMNRQLPQFLDEQEIMRYGSQFLKRVKIFEIGEGSQVLRADRSGLWLGGNKFIDALFSVDMIGNIVMTTARIVVKIANAIKTVGKLFFTQYTSGGNTINEVHVQVIEDASNDRVTYNTLDIYKNDQVTRDVFLQMSVAYSAGVFQNSTLNFAKDGQTGTLIVVMDNTNGNGYMDIPQRASDPPTASRRMYFNTTTGKIRVCDNVGWHDI